MRGVRGFGSCSFPLSRRSKFCLGSPELGSGILADRSDGYYDSLSTQEIVARLKRNVSVEEFIDIQCRSVLEFEDKDVENLENVVHGMKKEIETEYPMLEKFMPEEINFFMTTGMEETGFDDFSSKSKIAYCRGQRSVFMSRAMLDWSDAFRVRHLMWHELWHILSRNMSKEDIDAVYAAFGFRRLPNVLRNNVSAKLSNPDALRIEHCVRVSDGSLDLDVVPLLFVDPSVDPLNKKSSCFDHLVILFGIVEGDAWKTNEQGRMALLEMGQHRGLRESLFDQIGRNTNYLLHVEEVVAENFAFLAHKEVCPDVAKVQQLKSVLQSL